METYSGWGEKAKTSLLANSFRTISDRDTWTTKRIAEKKVETSVKNSGSFIEDETVEWFSVSNLPRVDVWWNVPDFLQSKVW